MTDTRIIDCEEALRRLLDVLDNELHGEGRHEFEHHLDRCRSCFSRFELERRLKTRISALGSEPVSDGLEDRVRQVIDSFKR
jgi:mycothiol system anti-sigma-R factor